MSYNYETSLTQTLSSIYTYTANIIAYDVTTNIATLDAPVDISLGYNDKIGQLSSQYNITGTSLNISQAIQKGKAATLSTDESGNFIGIFNVPSTTFQTGQRVFRVDNRTVDTDPTSATTYAEATFTASGLATTSQQLEFAPSIDSTSSSFTSVSQGPTKLVSTITTYSPYDPVAQTFILDKSNYPNGLFIKSLKLFFATKPTTNIPVKVSIVPTVNGYPQGKALDYSTVVLTGDKILTSKNPHYLDSSTYTEFTFQAPVYIQSGTLYAILIEANSPEYTVYLAQQNSIAVPSTAKALPTDSNPNNPTKIGAAPYVGALFESQNAITWTADQTKDLMFVIDRCVFNTSLTPQISFNLLKGLPHRKLGQNDIQYKLDANNLTNLHGNYNNNNLWADAFNVTTTDFTPTSTTVDYQYNTTLVNGNTPIGPFHVSPGKYGSPTPENIPLDDGQGERVLLSNSNNSFYLTATLSSSDANVSPIISDDGVSLYNIRYIINNMGIGNNVISITNSGAGYSNTDIDVTVSSPDVGSDSAVLGAYADATGKASVYVIYEGSGYIKTPTVQVTGSNTTPAVVSVYGETGSHGGNSWARYFTKKVVLSPANKSGDLRVYYTGYKPLGTSIYVYYKILSSDDSQKFDDGSWQLMTQVSNQNVYSSTTSDYIEFECAPGVNGQADNMIGYTSTNGQTYNNFTQFAIKVVMASSDRTIVPIIKDIRALALPSGTGI